MQKAADTLNLSELLHPSEKDQERVAQDLQECPYDSTPASDKGSNEPSDDVNDDKLCTRFAGILHKHTSRFFRTKLKQLRERENLDVRIENAASPIMKKFVLDFYQEVSSGSGSRGSIEELVDVQ
eukprot:820613-Rhodomonas_salina.1